MTSQLNSSGVPTRYRGFSWSKILDALAISPAQGDILYRASSLWSRLAAGASGRLLKTNGTGADPSWATPFFGTLSFVGSSTVTGSAATDLTISGLDLDSSGVFYFEVSIDNESGSPSSLSLYYNSDTTSTNYYKEYVLSVATSLTNQSGNDAILVAAVPAGNTSVLHGWIRKNFDDFPRCDFMATRSSSATRVASTGWHLYDTSGNITSLTIHSSISSALSIGSTIKVWSLSAA